MQGQRGGAGHSQYGGRRVWSLRLITVYNTHHLQTFYHFYSDSFKYNSLRANWIFPQQSFTVGGDATAIFDFIVGSRRLLKWYLKMAVIIMAADEFGKPIVTRKL